MGCGTKIGHSIENSLTEVVVNALFGVDVVRAKYNRCSYWGFGHRVYGWCNIKRFILLYDFGKPLKEYALEDKKND